MMRVFIFLLIIVSFVDAKKIALIVGISDYENYPKLHTPIDDVRGMNNALKNMGFKTLTLRNCSKSEFKKIIERFRKEAFDAKIALIYFSGHGTAIDGKNYLFLKDDERINNEKDIRKLFKLDEFIHILSGAESGVAIIDTCHSNLIIKKNQKGFVPILAKSNTVILTASRFGKTAFDKEGILTKILLKIIKEKTSLNEILQKTQEYVFRETKYHQSPTIINLDKASSIYLGKRPSMSRSVIESPPKHEETSASIDREELLVSNGIDKIVTQMEIYRGDIVVKSHGYTFISTIMDIKKLKNMNTYVFLPDNLSSQTNHNSKKYKRYEKVLELIQESPKYDINITSLGTKAKEINRFILMNKKSNKKKITVESYNYDLANRILGIIRKRNDTNEIDNMFFTFKFIFSSGPYLITTTENILDINGSKKYLFLDLSDFNDSAIEEIIRSYKQHLINDGNVDFTSLEKFKHKVLSLITNINSNIKTMHKAVTGEL